MHPTTTEHTAPPKIAHITTIDMSLRYLLLNQLRSIAAAGCHVTGISTPGPYVPEIEAAGIRHLPAPMTRSLSPLADLAALARLVRIFRRQRFTIVHTHNPKPGLLGQLAARLARVPIVVNTLHGFYFHDNMRPAARAFYIALEKLAARCSSLILSQNPEDMRTAIRLGISPPERIRWLGNGIDLAHFAPTRVRGSRNAQNLATKRVSLQLPPAAPAAPVVGFVGRLVAEKGIHELLAAARTVLQQHPAARFLIIGPHDPEKPDALTPAIAQDYGVAHACIFAGMRQDMPDLYALMDVFVLPSHREGFPRSPMEASAMGVPCVVTDIRGCREAVKHGENGLLVPLGDVPALAAAINTILDQPDRGQTMGATGRRMAQEHFDEQLVFGRVKAEYARLLAEKGLPVPAGLLHDSTATRAGELVGEPSPVVHATQEQP